MSKNVVYITLQGDDKILQFELNDETGTLEPQAEISITGGPAPLAVSPNQKFLYVGLRTSHEIASFRIDPNTGSLSHLGTISLDDNPCFITTDKTGHYLLATYYGAGKVTVNNITADGIVTDQQIQVIKTAEHAHYIELDRNNQFGFVPHTEPANVIFQFRFDEATGYLSPNIPEKLLANPGNGPRHYIYHPSRNWVYTSDEDGSSITAHHFDPEAGTLSAFQTLSTLPKEFAGKNTCAQIHIHSSGKFLYVSNRGHNSIACFAIDDETGQLASLGQQLTEPIPRVFNLDPGGNFLYAAGQGSGWLAGYRIDPVNGTLQPLERYSLGKQPMWVVILALG